MKPSLNKHEYETVTKYRIYLVDENGLLKRPRGQGFNENRFEDYDTFDEASYDLLKEEYHGEVVILPISSLQIKWD